MTICKVHRLIRVGYFYLLRFKNCQCLELRAAGGEGRGEGREKRNKKGGGEEVERWGKERKEGGGRWEEGVQSPGSTCTFFFLLETFLGNQGRDRVSGVS